MAQAALGTALFASGAISTWRAATLVDVLFRHDTMHNGDDLQQGLILHSLAGKSFYVPPADTHLRTHPGRYKVAVSGAIVATDVPCHWMHLRDVFGVLPARCCVVPVS